jgi:hypothetical protein
MAEKGFIFNLLPGKSKEEIEKVDSRDTNLLYIGLLLLVFSFVWVGITLANSILIDNSKKLWQERIADQQNQILGYAQDKRSNGELTEKTFALEEVIVKNIDPEEFFELVEGRITETSPTSTIKSYGREDSGTFNVSGQSANFLEISKIVYAFTSDESFSEVKLQNVAQDFEENKVLFNLSFLFVGTEEST